MAQLYLSILSIKKNEGVGLIATGQMDGKKKGCLGGVFHFILKVADR
jgi:hypothetical protein